MQQLPTNTTFLFRKEVDKSVLFQGFSISNKYYELLKVVAGQCLQYGEGHKVKLWFDGKEYEVSLRNNGFDLGKWGNHKDIMQFRYDSNTELIQHLRKVFHVSADYILPRQAAKAKGDRSHIRVPEETREYLVIQATPFQNVFVLDSITASETVEAHKELAGVSEYSFEAPMDLEIKDPTAGYGISAAVHHYRKLDKSVGDTLKKAYNYTCQVTGERVGDEYDALVVEAHHILPFTESLNNHASNIIILSPTFHRIVHRAKPFFNRKTLTFEFPNGVKEPVKTNLHLQ